MENKPLQWHPALYSTLQIELKDEPLLFLNEYNLTRKPLQMDILVIKKMDGRKIQKSIGQIFRRHNIIEYKSPEDYFSVNDFFKVLSYAGIYQSNTAKVLEILPEDITISLIANHYPKKMVAYLKRLYQADIKKAFPGIYYLTGLPFATQIIVIKQLSKPDNQWLSRLRPGLNAKDDLQILMEEYQGKQDNPLYSTSMDVIIRANREIYEEGLEMCDALRELVDDKVKKMEPEIERRIERRIERKIEQKIRMIHTIELICKKLKKQKTEEEIAEILDEDLAVIQQICRIVKEFDPEYPSEDIYRKWAEEFSPST